MDVDTVTKENSHEKILTDFKENKADILIGTQMVVKRTSFSKCYISRSNCSRWKLEYE